MLRILRVLAALTVCDGLRGAMSVRSGRSLRAPPSARMSAGLWQQLGGTASRTGAAARGPLSAPTPLWWRGARRCRTRLSAACRRGPRGSLRTGRACLLVVVGPFLCGALSVTAVRRFVSVIGAARSARTRRPRARLHRVRLRALVGLRTAGRQGGAGDHGRAGHRHRPHAHLPAPHV